MATYTNFALNSQQGTLADNPTVTTLVTAPTGSNIITVKNITIQNADTVAQVITINYLVTATNYIIWSGTLNSGDTLVLGEEDLYVLDATTKSITAIMAGSHTTTSPNWISGYATQS